MRPSFLTLSFWVKPHPHGWVVLGEGVPGSEDIYRSRDVAVAAARHLARLVYGELTVCGEDGLVVERESFQGT